MGSSHDILAKMVDCGFEVIEFELQSSNYIHFQTNINENGSERRYPPAMSQIVSLLFFNKNSFGIQ